MKNICILLLLVALLLPNVCFPQTNDFFKVDRQQTNTWEDYVINNHIKQPPEFLLSSAKTNNLVAQYNLATLYMNKKIPFYNPKQAFYWFTRILHCNSCSYKNFNKLPNAKNNLGVLYLNGIGTHKDIKKAVSLFKSSNNKYSQYNLGLIFLNKINKKGNLHKAFVSFKNSALLGYAPAQYNIGIMYLKGDYVHKDIKKAYFWINKSANQNYNKAIKTRLTLNKKYK